MTSISHWRPLAAVVTAALLLALAAPVRAQSASPDRDRVALALQLLQVSGTSEIMLGTLQQSVQAQRIAMPQVPAEFWSRFEAQMKAETPRLLDSVAVAYAKLLSAEELNGLLVFHRSPLGQRMRMLQPTLVAETSRLGQQWGARIGQEVGASMSR